MSAAVGCDVAAALRRFARYSGRPSRLRDDCAMQLAPPPRGRREGASTVLDVAAGPPTRRAVYFAEPPPPPAPVLCSDPHHLQRARLAPIRILYGAIGRPPTSGDALERLLALPNALRKQRQVGQGGGSFPGVRLRSSWLRLSWLIRASTTSVHGLFWILCAAHYRIAETLLHPSALAMPA